MVWDAPRTPLLSDAVDAIWMRAYLADTMTCYYELKDNSVSYSSQTLESSSNKVFAEVLKQSRWFFVVQLIENRKSLLFEDCSKSAIESEHYSNIV